MKSGLGYFLAFILIVPLEAQNSPRWRISDDERLLERFGAEAVRMRLARFAERRLSGVPASEALVNIINGDETPELFLPWELFQHLIQTTTDPKPQARAFARAQYARRAPWIAGKEDFWPTLERIAHEYLQHIDETRRVAATLESASDTEIERVLASRPQPERQQCASRAAALEAAREHYGRATFDEFLYVAVAPGLVSWSSGADAPTAARLRHIAGGCR